MWSPRAGRVIDAAIAVQRATAKLLKLTRAVYPIGQRVECRLIRTGRLMVGTVRFYQEPLSAGLVVEFAPDDVAAWSPCWRCSESCGVPNCVMVGWAYLQGPVEDQDPEVKP